MEEGSKKGDKARAKHEKEFPELSVLGLNETEEQIIVGLLELGPASVSKLSRETGLPHTTIHYAIRKLRDQGLVRRLPIQHRSVWKVVKPEKVKKRLGSALKTLTNGPSLEEIEEEAGVSVSENTEIHIFRGTEQMLKIYQWFLLNHRNERVCGIQTLASQEIILKELPKPAISAINHLVKQNKIIVDAVLPESIQYLYRRYLPENRELHESIAGRTTAARLVPDEFLDFSADLLIAHDIGFLANWDEGVLILIKNPDLVLLLRHLFEFMKEFGKPFDQNAFLQSIIEKGEESV